MCRGHVNDEFTYVLEWQGMSRGCRSSAAFLWFDVFTVAATTFCTTFFVVNLCTCR